MIVCPLLTACSYGLSFAYNRYPKGGGGEEAEVSGDPPDEEGEGVVADNPGESSLLA